MIKIKRNVLFINNAIIKYCDYAGIKCSGTIFKSIFCIFIICRVHRKIIAPALRVSIQLHLLYI